MSDGQVLGQDTNPVLDLVGAARLVAPEVLRVRERTEELRQIPPSLADVISNAGLYQMFLPRSVGGPEASPWLPFTR
jgi:hypothetical protein